MRTIAKLFGRSPFIPLKNHMEKVAECVGRIRAIFEAYEAGDQQHIQKLADEISDLEHEADQAKQDIRNHLPRGLFLPVAQERLLDILSVQDNIADKAENIASLLTLRPMKDFDGRREFFPAFLDKNLQTFDGVLQIMHELDQILEVSFGGAEADKVREMVDEVSRLEHEADVIQHDLVKCIFTHEGQLTHGEFYLWTRVFSEVSQISNLSERLAHRVRTTLEIK